MTALVLTLLLAAQTPSTPANQAPTTSAERPSAELLIDASFVDRKGQPVTDLRQEEVEVWIDGYRIPIDSFVAPASGSSPRTVTLLIDDVSLAPLGLARAKDAARRFVQRMAPGDQMAVVGLSGTASQLTPDGAMLEKRIDALSIPATLFLRQEDLAAHVFETVALIARQVGESGAKRGTIVGIGSGWLFDAPVPVTPAVRRIDQHWTAAVRSMAGANVTLYVIDPGGLGMSSYPAHRDGFASDMGGHAFTNTNDASGAVDRIMREIVTRYTIGVTDPPVGRKALVREMDVRVLRRGVSVRARRYIAGKSGPSQP